MNCITARFVVVCFISCYFTFTGVPVFENGYVHAVHKEARRGQDIPRSRVTGVAEQLGLSVGRTQVLWKSNVPSLSAALSSSCLFHAVY